MNKIKAVIFDMDGVILDSESVCDRTWEIASEELNLDPQKAMEAIDACRGTNKEDTKKILLDYFGNDFDVEKFLQRTSELFYEIEAEGGLKLMPYAKEALEYLHSKYTLALASSTRGPVVERQLTNAGVIHFFKTRTTGEMVEHSKPDPEIYLMACKSIGLEPEECAAIEDSPNGVKSACAARIKTILIPDRSKPSEEIIRMSWKTLSDLSEISTIL